MNPRSAAVWAIRYGLPSLAIRTAARRGDVIARSSVDPAALDDPAVLYEELRAGGPIVSNQFAAASAHHAVVNEILRSDDFRADPGGSPARFLDKVLAAAIDPRALGPVDNPSLLAIQPPQHTRIRKLVSHAFTPRAIAAYAPRIRALAEEFLDRMGGHVELVAEYAALLPVTVIAEIIGLPVEQRAAFLRIGNDAAATLDPVLGWRDFRTADRAIRDSHVRLDEHIAALRRDPGDDLLSRLIEVRDGGDRLSDEELRVNTLLLLGAGFETTVNLIGNAVTLLLAHSEQLAALKADPSGWGGAVDEVLRYDSPVQLTVRTATRDTTVAGTRIPAGRFVVLMLGAANRDPAVFADPDRFDIARTDARQHLAFSAGIHYCLGAQLARLEATIALQALFERYPDLAADGPPTRRRTRVLRGFERVPLATGSGVRAA